MRLTLLDRYILGEWLKVFLMALAAVIGLLLVARVFELAPDFMRWGTPAPSALACFALQVPAYLPAVLPVTLLVSVLFQLGQLHRNQELTAMRAAGQSVFRITRPLWLAGAALSFLLLALNASLVPIATELERGIRDAAEFDFKQKQKTDAAATAATATAAPADTAAAADTAPPATAAPAPPASAPPAKPTGRGKLTTQFYANNSANRIWSFNHFDGYTGRGRGVHIHQNDPTGAPVEAWLAAYGEFDSTRGYWTLRDGRHLRYGPGGRLLAEPYFKELALPVLTEEPRLMHAMSRSDKPHQLSIHEIQGVLEHVGGDGSPRMASLVVRYHTILASPFCCLIVVGIAIPFTVAGIRVNPMIGISKSLLLFGLYYLSTIVFSLFGAQRILPPLLAAWLPNILMLSLAALLCRRVN